MVRTASRVQSAWARRRWLDHTLTAWFAFLRGLPVFFVGLGLFPLARAVTPFRPHASTRFGRPRVLRGPVMEGSALLAASALLAPSAPRGCSITTRAPSSGGC